MCRDPFCEEHFNSAIYEDLWWLGHCLRRQLGFGTELVSVCEWWRYNVHRHRKAIRDRRSGRRPTVWHTLSTDTFWMRRFQLARHSYGCHRDAGSEEMLSERRCHILLPSGGCAPHSKIAKEKNKQETTEGDSATGTHPSFIGSFLCLHAFMRTS